jgi:hypothetical protein
MVAAGLVVSALNSAHEAGWLNAGQQHVVDMSAVVRPGSGQEALLTGMLGIQTHTTFIDVVGWSVYLVPVMAFAAGGHRRGRRSRGSATDRHRRVRTVLVRRAIRLVRQAPRGPDRRLGQFDGLNEYIKHVGGGLWAVPPGLTGPGDWYGREIFG